MCESAAYILKEDGMERIMDNVVSVDPFEGKVYLTDLLGEQKNSGWRNKRNKAKWIIR